MNKHPLKISISQAAKLIGKSELFVREGMRRELLPIGTAMQMPGSTKWTFVISPSMLAAYLGVDVALIWQMLKEDVSA